MNGIVAEINGKYAIILTKDGSFVKVKTAADMIVGQEIGIDRPAGKAKRASLVRKITSIAAAGLLALGVGYAGYCYTLPYSYVHVDINPSIELTVNVYDRIIGVEALNSGGEELLGGSNLKNHKVDTAVKQLLNVAVQHGYLNGEEQQTIEEPDITQVGQALDNPQKADKEQATVKDINEAQTKTDSPIENAVLLTVSSNNSRKSNALRDNIADVATEELKKEKVKSEILVGEASVEQRDDARRFGVTPGKMVLIEDALELEGESGSQIEELKRAPIKDLLKKASDKADKQAKEKAKREEQQAKEKAKREEQQTKAKAKREEQQAKAKAKREEQQVKQNENKGNSFKQDGAGKHEKSNSKKRQKDLKEEREKLREDLLRQIEGRKKNYFDKQDQRPF